MRAAVVTLFSWAAIFAVGAWSGAFEGSSAQTVKPCPYLAEEGGLAPGELCDLTPRTIEIPRSESADDYRHPSSCGGVASLKSEGALCAKGNRRRLLLTQDPVKGDIYVDHEDAVRVLLAIRDYRYDGVWENGLPSDAHVVVVNDLLARAEDPDFILDRVPTPEAGGLDHIAQASQIPSADPQAPARNIHGRYLPPKLPFLSALRSVASDLRPVAIRTSSIAFPPYVRPFGSKSGAGGNPNPLGPGAVRSLPEVRLPTAPRFQTAPVQQASSTEASRPRGPFPNPPFDLENDNVWEVKGKRNVRYGSHPTKNAATEILAAIVKKKLSDRSQSIEGNEKEIAVEIVNEFYEEYYKPIAKELAQALREYKRKMLRAIAGESKELDGMPRKESTAHSKKKSEEERPVKGFGIGIETNDLLRTWKRYRELVEKILARVNKNDVKDFDGEVIAAKLVSLDPAIHEALQYFMDYNDDVSTGIRQATLADIIINKLEQRLIQDFPDLNSKDDQGSFSGNELNRKKKRVLYSIAIALFRQSAKDGTLGEARMETALPETRSKLG